MLNYEEFSLFVQDINYSTLYGEIPSKNVK